MTTVKEKIKDKIEINHDDYGDFNGWIGEKEKEFTLQKMTEKDDSKIKLKTRK